MNIYLYNMNMHILIEYEYTDILCFMALCFIVPHRYCIFYKLKVCGNPVSGKSISAIFPTAFVHFIALCHVPVMLAIFQNFSLLFYLLW